jgi:uncharacterized protein (DUF2236 family)
MSARLQPIRLPRPLQGWLESAAQRQLQGAGSPGVDFSRPAGEPALVSADSISWQVFRNPVSLLIGGVAAVLLELAEPRVRAGVWENTSFRRDPVRRMQRTGLAAMVTVYGARSAAETMIAGVRRMHDAIRGKTAAGLAYHAGDPELLRWVQATAAFGFLEAYERYVRPLGTAERDKYYAEGELASLLYGVSDLPNSQAELASLFEGTFASLEASEVIFEFLDILGRAELLPAPLRPLQRMLLRAAVEITPAPVRAILGLGAECGLRRWETALVRRLGRVADRIVIESSPPVQACLRLGLRADHLIRRPA